ncbi:unnamed protein product [Musa acuminata subsp. malaccensis]|uniref:(wild Malaysian banana) hypothetical protein n=1 Tax=Musa acuminata subsp. malaccensis TaxID=214687 RepID=A0A804IZX1_MUSAM|nr:unnamed protein product [Musa acuminata subsp. malaccensis]
MEWIPPSPPLTTLMEWILPKQAAIACSRTHGLRIRVRSGGHDYEDMSYVSAGDDPFVVVDISSLRSTTTSLPGFPAGICTTVGVGVQWKRTIQVICQGMFLGRRRALLSVMKKSFSELGLEATDCSEVSWLESTLHFADYSSINSTILLDRRPQHNSSFKAKSEKGWKGIWKLMTEAMVMIMEPWGGRMGEIAGTTIVFHHRKGNLYNIQYLDEVAKVDPENHLWNEQSILPFSM